VTRERSIVEAFIAAIDAATTTPVVEDRGYSADATTLPLVDVTAESSDVELVELEGLQLEHTLTIEVSIVARETTTASASKSADALAAAVHAAVTTASGISSLVSQLTVGSTNWQRERTGDGVIVRRTTQYTVKHVTSATNIQNAP
jgi:hypothetical protein